MSSEDLGSEKHLNIGDRRKRFDPKSRYGGHGGASLVTALPNKLVSVDGYNRIYLDIERPRNDQGCVLISKIDQEVPELCRSAELPPGLALQLPEMLDQLCITKSTKRDKCSHDVVITTYVLQGVDWMAPNQEERALLEKRRNARLTLLAENASSGRSRPLCKLPDAPLEKIADPSLLDINSRLSAPRHDVRCGPHFARVFSEDVANCFLPSEGVVEHSARSDIGFLQVDLGATCQVTFVSTQGRFPPIQGTDKETRSRIVQEGHLAYNNWVMSYEISYRSASGHDWVSLGEFKGNSDMNTEVAHEMTSLTCRFLRFRPLQYHGQPAMRVGVYGKRTDMEGLRRKHMPESDEVVQYSIHRMKENANTRRVLVGCGLCRYGCAKCNKTRGPCALSLESGPKSRRMRLRAGVVQEVRVLASDDASRGLLVVDEDAEEAAPASIGTEAAAPPTGPRAPVLARQRSLSDPNLSSAPSCSSWTLGESVEVVQDIGQFDENEWLIFNE